MFDDEKVLLMEFARRLMTDHVTLARVVEHRIGATETLKGTISATRQRFHARRTYDAAYQITAKNLLIGIAVNISKSKLFISHLS